MLSVVFVEAVKKQTNRFFDRISSEERKMEKIGLLAGVGRLPIAFAKAAHGMGFEVSAVALVNDVEIDLQENVENFADISIGKLDSIIQFLKQHQITKVTMIGKVTKEMMFSGQVEVDERMKKLLIALPDRNDDTIMYAFVRELAMEGIQAFDQTALIRSMIVAEGIFTKREPTEAEKADMEYGFKMAKAIGGLDIGQTVVVKDLAVMAVEAIEGTDACILRGGELGRGDVVVAKVAKPKQDVRFDMPAVGVKTLESMIRAGAKALVMEAGKTLLIEKEKVVALADENGITIVAL